MGIAVLLAQRASAPLHAPRVSKFPAWNMLYYFFFWHSKRACTPLLPLLCLNSPLVITLFTFSFRLPASVFGCQCIWFWWRVTWSLCLSAPRFAVCGQVLSFLVLSLPFRTFHPRLSKLPFLTSWHRPLLRSLCHRIIRICICANFIAL
jgi:hypothetical protein